MKYLLLLLLPCTLFSQTWVQLPDFPDTKRDDGVSVVVEQKAYFGTGLQEWNATISFRVLDLTTLQWGSIPDMPHTTERQYACAFPGTNCFYVFGGYAATALNTLFKFDISTGTWTEMSPKPGPGLAAAVAFDYGDQVIISNGKLADNSLNNEVWQYTKSSDTWVKKNNFSGKPVWRAAGAVCENNGYLLSGIDSAGHFSNRLYKYDLLQDAWFPWGFSPDNKGRAYASMQAAGNRIFIFGGMDSAQNYLNDLWYYDALTGEYIKGPDLPGIGRRGGMSSCDGRNFYYCCGLSATGRLTETWRTDMPTALAEYGLKDWSVFPNPFTDEINISQLPPGAEYRIISVTGEMVDSGALQNETLRPVISIPGIYTLQISTRDGQVFTRKLVRK